MIDRHTYVREFFQTLPRRILFSAPIDVSNQSVSSPSETLAELASVNFSLSNGDENPLPQYSDPINVNLDTSAPGIVFDRWSSDDLGMLIGANETITVVHDKDSWTVILPDDAILFRDTIGYFGLGFWEFEPLTLRNASNTATFTLTPSHAVWENTYQVTDFEAGGFKTRDAAAGIGNRELAARDWSNDGAASVKLAWIGDAGGIDADIRFAPAAVRPTSAIEPSDGSSQRPMTPNAKGYIEASVAAVNAIESIPSSLTEAEQPSLIAPAAFSYDTQLNLFAASPSHAPSGVLNIFRAFDFLDRAVRSAADREIYSMPSAL